MNVEGNFNLVNWLKDTYVVLTCSCTLYRLTKVCVIFCNSFPGLNTFLYNKIPEACVLPSNLNFRLYNKLFIKF